MKPRFNEGTVGRCIALTALLLVNACSGVDGEGFDQDGANGDEGTAEGALHDATIMDGSAKLALVPAARASLRSATDITNPQFPRQVEYCGLIFKKSNNAGFSASGLYTTHELRHCEAKNVPIPAGSTIVGFYHTHTPDSVPGISEDDKVEARAKRRVYYVVTTKTKCTNGGYPAEKWDPAVGGDPKHVACLFF
jgi:hypothetical protein